MAAILNGLNAWRDNKTIVPQVYTDEIQLALQHQNNIGWQQLLEGMMASAWTRLQAQHYVHIRSKKTSRSWAAGLIKQLVKTGQLQWKHRNDYKHMVGKPRHKQHIFRVNQEMLRELQRGTDTLLSSDAHKVDYAAMELLQKPLSFKKSWLLNVSRARQRFLRIKHQDDELEATSRETSALIKWMLTKQTPTQSALVD